MPSHYIQITTLSLKFSNGHNFSLIWIKFEQKISFWPKKGIKLKIFRKKYFVMPKITKTQILTLKFHFFTNFVNFSQRAIFFNYASPKKISDHKIFRKVKNKHACDPKMPKFGIFFSKNFFFEIVFPNHIYISYIMKIKPIAEF